MDIILTPPSTGAITQYYGNGSNRGVHSGNDYAYSSGGQIHKNAVAMAPGKVIWSDDTRKLGWPNKFYFNPDFDRTDATDHSAGIAVVLEHWFGWTTYCHLETTWLNDGDTVERGETVGIVGQTGFSLGKHLHAELILNEHDFSTNTGGRADLNEYMVEAIIETKEWDEMATKAELEEIIDRKLDEKLHKHLDEFRPGIPTKRKDGSTYTLLARRLDALQAFIQKVADVDRQYIPDRLEEVVKEK